MKSFRGTNSEYVASIAVDASTIGNVTVAVGCFATRSDEIEVLDSVRKSANATRVTFIPFKSKSRYFDKEDDSDFFERIIEKNERRLRALHFRHHSASRNQHYVEAVLTAILVDDIRRTADEPWFVLVDGNEQKAVAFARAFTGLGCSSPTVSYCYQSELYYPHALLSDLAAGYLAKNVAEGKYDYSDPTLRTSPADRTRTDKWGKAFDYLRTKSRAEYQLLGADTSYGATERDRAKIWFEGLMGRDPANDPAVASMKTITSDLRTRGYGPVAERLRKL